MPTTANEHSGARKARVLAAIAVAAVLFATLWPFNPQPRNGVSWLQATNGIRFQKAGLVISSQSLSLPQDAQSFTLELLLRPANASSSRTILTFCQTSCSTQFEVRQWWHGLLVTHNASIQSDSTGTVKIDVDDVFVPGRVVFVALASGPNGTTVYVDHHPEQVFPKFTISRADLSGDFFLGTSATDYDPWVGELRGFAVYARELTVQEVLQDSDAWIEGSPSAHLRPAVARYSFKERGGAEVHNEVAPSPSLEIPPIFSVPRKPFLQSPIEEFEFTHSYFHDAAANVGGFVPLGLIVCSSLVWTRSRRQAIFISIAFCGLLSFAIEVLQYYIPKRGSGITDIITNTVGAALGALLIQSKLLRGLMASIGLLPSTPTGVVQESARSNT